MPELRAFRVMRKFKWGGWTYAPKDGCRCNCSESQEHTWFDVEARVERTEKLPGPVPNCSRQVGTACPCNLTVCSCCCGVPQKEYAGDIWVVDVGTALERQEGRVFSMVEISRFARPDVTAQEEAVNPDGTIKTEFKHLLELRPEVAAAGGRRSR